MLRKNLFSGVAIAALTLGGPAFAQSQQGDQQNQQQAQSGQQQEQKEGAKLYVGSNVIVEAQKQLNQQGFDVGEVNGELSDGTKSAVENFQKENDLAATGELTIDTLQALGIDFMASSQQQGEGQIDGEPAELKVGPTVVSQIQKQLNERGFDVGEVNGKWNDETAKAAQAFQREEGMTATENLNVALIQALGVNLSGGAAQAEMPASEEAEATTLYIAPDLLRQVKMELNKQGFDAGSVDAEWNDEARSALKNYLKAQGVSETEELTVSALSTLGIDWRSGGGSQAAGGSMQIQGGGQQIEADVKVVQ